MADVLRFSAWLHARQHPADCGVTVGSFMRQEYFWGLGLGAQLVQLKYGFLSALLKGHVYHLPTSHYTNPVSCPSRSFDCYFEPASNCTRTSHRRAVDVSIRWCFDLPEAQLGAMASLRQPHPKEWFHAQLTAFLLRPNARLRTLAAELGTSLERSDPFSNESLTVATAAVHVRAPRKRRSTLSSAARAKVARAKTTRTRVARPAQAVSLRSHRAVNDGRRLQGAARGGKDGAAGGELSQAFNVSRCVAVHIRRTDKFKTNRREV